MVLKMDCQTCENKLSNYVDNTLSGVELAAFQKHVKACSKCSAELNAFQTILSESSLLEKLEAPESLWSRIESELDAPAPRFLAKIRDTLAEFGENLASILKIPAPVLQLAGVVAVLILGIVIGRYFLPVVHQVDLAQQVSAQKENIELIEQRTNRYVEKSKILFLGIVNADAADIEDSDWMTEKTMAQDLVREASFLMDNLSQMRKERIRLLVEELELILLEIAHLEKEHDAENIELIKSGIDQKWLLLKIYLHDMAEKPLITKDNSSLDVL